MAAQAPQSRQRAWFAALDHARLTGAKPTYNIRYDFYTVVSPGSGNRYIIRRHGWGVGLRYSCTCHAAIAGNVCWHRALVMALPYEISRRVQQQQ